MKKNYLILIIVVFLTGCSALKFPNINPPKPPQTMYSYEQSFTKNPTAVVAGDKIAVVENQDHRVYVNYKKKQPNLTYWQRVTNWLGNLGIIGIVLIVIGLFVAPGATIGFLFTSYGKTKKALRQTVRAIDEARAVNESTALKQSLSNNQDTDTKKIVDNVKREAQS